ncbi:DUF1642 domain-containing protein [Lactococcus cremoris]|uniref:DUF1642 domain-containing protein n=1 Tax=Lactococcus lactis subsp. cremoris TaxID=1359 RepID=UPI0021A3774F|nr:DUF1642 domain-containing protein [Lactococcus cremoris]MCT4429605.1 DUF1642 domain-containing protein [Lactococcus cremoris]
MTKFEEELSSLPVSKATKYAEYWNKAELLTVFKDWQLQQALPVVPERVADYISELKEKGFGIKFGLMCSTYDAAGEGNAKAIHWKDDNAEDFARAWLDGYEVEKPQLFYIDLPKVFGLSDSTSDSTFVAKAESGIISEFTKGKDYALKLTEQEIKSIDERYWQFAVPVEEEK